MGRNMHACAGRMGRTSSPLGGGGAVRALAARYEECSTSGTRGAPPTLCAAGLVCHILDPGRPELDRPDRGVCDLP